MKNKLEPGGAGGGFHPKPMAVHYTENKKDLKMTKKYKERLLTLAKELAAAKPKDSVIFYCKLNFLMGYILALEDSDD